MALFTGAASAADADGGGQTQGRWELPDGARDVSPEMRRKARQILQGSPENRQAGQRAADSMERKALGPPSQSSRQRARAAIGAAQPNAELRSSKVDSGERETYILISFSLGKDRLIDLFDTFGDRDVIFVLRGMMPNTRTLNPTLRTIRKMIQEAETAPNITLDPTVFREHGIEAVPAVAVAEGEQLVAKAVGTVAVDAIHRRIERGKTGDFGQWGEIQEIAERDLTEVLKARAENLDRDRIIEKAQGQFDDYWADKSLEGLPEAIESEERRFAPVTQATQTVRAPDGRVIFAKGDRINLLDLKPFSKQLIAFDGTQEDQVEVVERLLATTDKPVILTAARLDSENGWEHHDRLQQKFGRKLFRLPPSLVERFRIQRLPTVVESQGNEFVVREIAP